MDRNEFKQFISYFGTDEDILKFRLVHDFLSSSECWKEFGFNNSINLVIQKKELIRQIESVEKIRMLQENTSDRWLDIEDFNQKGYAVFVLPNLAHRKNDLMKIYSHCWDFDCGKEVYGVATEEEAKQLIAALRKRNDIETDGIKVKTLKRKKLPFSVTAYRTEEEIRRLKQQFLEKNAVYLEHCLINESPNGFRGLFIYEKGQEYNEEEYKRIQKGIIETLGTDPAFVQAVQPIRVSGFYHNKRTPSMVKTVQLPSSFITKEMMKKRFVFASQNSSHNCYKNTHNNIQQSRKKPILTTQKRESKKEMTFIEAIDFLKQQDITTIYPNFSYDHNFVCVFHDDHNPSARLGIHNGTTHLYGCFGCKTSMNLIDLYIELEKGGDRSKFREAVEELADLFGVEIVQSDFVTKELEKYQRNMDWIVKMFDEGEMERKYPELYRKFFARIVRYSYDKDGKRIKDKKGNDLCRKIAGRRERVLRKLTAYSIARLRDINVEGNALFWISFGHLAELMVHYDSDFKNVEQEKRKIFYLVKELELLGFIKQVELNKVPKNIQEKAKKLAEINYPNGKTYQKETINFYIMNDFYEMETLINQKALALIKEGYKNTVHRGKMATIIHQGEEVANQLYQDERKLDPYFLKIKKKLISHIEKELNKKGFIFKKDIIKPKIRVMSNYQYRYVTKKEKEKALDLLLYGKNGIIQELNLQELRLTKALSEELGVEFKKHRLQYIYLKRR